MTPSLKAQDLPWLIRLDKFVNGEGLELSTDLVVRSSNTQLSLNAVVPLDLFVDAALARREWILDKAGAGRNSCYRGDETFTAELSDDLVDATTIATEANSVREGISARGPHSAAGGAPAPRGRPAVAERPVA